MRLPIRKQTLIIIGIFVFAFAIRFVYLMQIKGSPMFDTLIMDAEYHDQWASSILKGEDFTEGVFFRAPLYPYFLAFIYKIFGHNYFPVRFIQFLLGSLSCVLVYLLGKRIFNQRTAMIAALLASLNGVLIYFEGELLIPVLEVFTGLLVIFACIRAAEKPSYARWFLCGMLLGLSALARPNFLLVSAALFFWIIFRFKGKAGSRSRSVLYAFIFAGAAALVISPVTLRNYVKGHDFVLIAWQGGMNFYIGNNPESDGSSATLPGARTTWWGSYGDAKKIAEKTVGRSLKPSELSRFWYVEGLKFMVKEPLRFLKLMLKKIFLFWNGNELANNRDLYFFTRSASVLKLLLWRFIIYLPFGLISPSALVGIILSHREKKDVVILEIFLFAYMLSVILFFVCARYRVPIIPVLILFSAYAINWMVMKARQKRFFQLGKYVLVFIAFLIPINLSMPEYQAANIAHAHYTMGVLYTEKGDAARAIEEFNQALEYRPHLSEAYVNLGAIYGDQGNYKLALEYLQKALQSGADSALVFFNMAVIYQNRGFLDQAQKLYERSLSLRDEDSEVHYLLGEVYLHKGMLKEAAGEYEKAIQYDPKHVLALYKLGSTYRQLGKGKEAISYLENFVKLEGIKPSEKDIIERLLRELKEE